MDRDGVVNKLPPKYPNEGIGDIRNYITRWEDLEYLPFVIRALKKVYQSDYLTIVISNQGGAIGMKMV